MRAGPGIVRRLGAPLAVLAFWCGMGAAAHAYPAGYDWAYQTISVLLYRDHNPYGYLWGWLGLWLCGLAGFAWTVQASHGPDTGSATPPALGLRLLQSGFVFMCCAVLPDQLLPWPRGHELFALLAFISISAGVTRQMMPVAERIETDERQVTATKTMIRRLGPAIPLLPLLLAGATQTYLTLERPNLPWVTPAWRTLGISPLLSFGLWEWVTCAVFSACLLVLWKRHLVRP